MSAGIRGLTFAQRMALANQMHGAVESAPTTFGLTTLQAAALQTAIDAVTAKAIAASQAQTQAKAATAAKATAMDGLTNSLVQFAKIIYAFPAITDEQLEAAGLSIPAKPTRRTAKTPLNVVANATANGGVTVSWKRNGNPQGILFMVQEQQANGSWVTVTSTTASKVTLSGYTPGVQVNFRVIAITHSIPSLPSTPAAIYMPDQATVQLKIAA